jgi:phosphoglycolate phosphatase
MSSPPKPGIEILRPPAGRQFTCALLDFDGTISLIRQGWQDVMIPMMMKVLSGLDHGLSESQLHDLIREDVTVLTGRQTIYQMIRLAERVRQFGGTPAEPLEYKREYHRRLMARIAHRRQGLARGDCPPDTMMLAGARPMLEALRTRGLKLYLTSGTDEPYVVEEARLLQIAQYFDGGIYGARDDYKTYSKAAVVRRMLSDNRIAGPDLLGIGDGFVEIVNVREVGGYAVGVASDEARGGGRADAWKRDRLIQAGADMIVPDFANLEGILEVLFGPGS